MKITYRFYESEKDLQRQIDFWIKRTKLLPYAWKPTISPNIFIEQENFHPKSRCFAFDGNQMVGYMSFTGSKEFVSLGYPWVLPGYEGIIQDELFKRVYGFAESDEFGAKLFAQRFRSDWKEQIDFFLSKGFEVTRRSPILIKELSDSNHTNASKVENDFQFDKWANVTKQNEVVTEEQLSMMKEYYGSVQFDFSISFENEGYFGVTIRKDTAYAEILAVALKKDTTKFLDMVNHVLKECENRGVKVVGIAESHLPQKESLRDLGFLVLTEDVMLMKQ
ncbi:MAG: hypothetical protein KKF57_04885 [Firmicutes bacterium]|nr:hypothetical protein [Bacillota bacterium]